VRNMYTPSQFWLVTGKTGKNQLVESLWNLVHFKKWLMPFCKAMSISYPIFHFDGQISTIISKYRNVKLQRKKGTLNKNAYFAYRW
jgi:hypothetical protein